MRATESETLRTTMTIDCAAETDGGQSGFKLQNTEYHVRVSNNTPRELFGIMAHSVLLGAKVQILYFVVLVLVQPWTLVRLQPVGLRDLTARHAWTAREPEMAMSVYTL